MNAPWRLSPPAPHWASLRERTIFEACKWDPQVEDVPVLSRQALLLRPESWRELCGHASALARETLQAEAELLQHPKLHDRLGLPRGLRKALRRAAQGGPSASGPRWMRFDFHWTTRGWRISEVNSDVPGGLNESSGYTRLFAEQFPGHSPPGDPVVELARRLVTAAEDQWVALVHATSYTDDRQSMVFLAKAIQEAGGRPALVGPDHCEWPPGGRARLQTPWAEGNVGAIFRFFPAEWLPKLARSCPWIHFFTGSRTPMTNPGTALLTQSKRFPLVWESLSTPLPHWRRLLPATREPRQVRWKTDPEWVVKPACGRVGDGIGMQGITTPAEWKVIRWSVAWEPGSWAAQERFHTLPLTAWDGRPVYPCLGVYTVGERVAGAYGRIARHPLINHLAQDAPVLLDSEPAAAPIAPCYEPAAAV